MRSSKLGEMRNAYKISNGNLTGGDLGIYGRIILKWTLKKVSWCGLGSSDSGCKTMTGFYKHGNEPSDTIKCGTSLII
jgi:hypothetical protein